MAAIWPHFAMYPQLPALVKADEIDFGAIDAVFGCLPHAASGLALALNLRELGQKVLLISGETHTSLRENAQRNHLSLLIKPVSSAQLLTALQQL